MFNLVRAAQSFGADRVDSFARRGKHNCFSQTPETEVTLAWQDLSAKDFPNLYCNKRLFAYLFGTCFAKHKWFVWNMLNAALYERLRCAIEFCGIDSTCHPGAMI